MTRERDVERILDRWFDDGPTQAPDRVLDAVADRIERQPQRPAWRLPKESHVNGYLKPLLAVAAVLVIAVVGYNLLPGNSVGGPQSTPSPSATATVAPSPTGSPTGSLKPVACADPAFGCAGALTAGAHVSAAFQPQLTYEIPEGWANTLDRARTYSFLAPGNTLSLQVMSEVAIPEQNAGCTAERKSGAGNTVADWVAFLETHPGLAATAPEPVTVGGYAGERITVFVGGAWPMTCPRSIGPAVVLITDSGATPDRVFWIDDQVTTFTILDVAGETVIIHMESGTGADANANDQRTVQPIIDSMRFNPGG